MKPLLRLNCVLALVLLPLVAPGVGVCRPVSEDRPAGIPESAEQLPGWTAKDISAWRDGERLFVILRKDPADGIVRIPRLANVVRSIHWLDDTGTELKLQPELATWIIKAEPSSKIKPTSASSLVLVLNLDAPPRVFDEQLVSEPNADGIITLPAKFAVTHGETLRFEPQPHKNTVGYWSNDRDFAAWHYGLKAAGKYEIDILQGCGKGHGGSKVSCKTEAGSLDFEVQETGHFQNFIWRTVGTVELNATARGSLSLVPVHKSAGAVMDVRAIRIVPIGKERSFEPELVDPSSLPSAK